MSTTLRSPCGWRSCYTSLRTRTGVLALGIAFQFTAISAAASMPSTALFNTAHVAVGLEAIQSRSALPVVFAELQGALLLHPEFSEGVGAMGAEVQRTINWLPNMLWMAIVGLLGYIMVLKSQLTARLSRVQRSVSQPAAEKRSGWFSHAFWGLFWAVIIHVAGELGLFEHTFIMRIPAWVVPTAIFFGVVAWRNREWISELRGTPAKAPAQAPQRPVKRTAAAPPKEAGTPPNTTPPDAATPAVAAEDEAAVQTRNASGRRAIARVVVLFLLVASITVYAVWPSESPWMTSPHWEGSGKVEPEPHNAINLFITWSTTSPDSGRGAYYYPYWGLGNVRIPLIATRQMGEDGYVHMRFCVCDSVVLACVGEVFELVAHPDSIYAKGTWTDVEGKTLECWFILGEKYNPPVKDPPVRSEPIKPTRTPVAVQGTPRKSPRTSVSGTSPITGSMLLGQVSVVDTVFVQRYVDVPIDGLSSIREGSHLAVIQPALIELPDGRTVQVQPGSIVEIRQLTTTAVNDYARVVADVNVIHNSSKP